MELEREHSAPLRSLEAEYETGRQGEYRVTTTTYRPWSTEMTAVRRTLIMTLEELAELIEEDGDGIVAIEPWE